jgi:UDP-N-acetylmuramoyl-tripeptide--D-alanyl-D-alanine ligase
MDELPKEINYNTLNALDKTILHENIHLANQKRELFKNNVIAVTGTSGKTTTCLMLYEVLKTMFKTDKSHVDYNGFEGINYCIRNIFNLDSQFWIQEIGIDHPNTMKIHVDLIQPTVRILTNIYEAHSCYFKNREHYQNEKLSFLDNMPDNSLLIINNDDDIISKYIQENNLKNIKVMYCGSKDTDHVQLYHYRINTDNISSTIHIKIHTCDNDKKDIILNVNGIGKHYGINACLAIACAVNYNIPIPSIINALDNFTLNEGRGLIFNKKNFVIFDYTYNMVPAACISNLNEFSKINEEHKIIIIGGNSCDISKEYKNTSYAEIIEKALMITTNVIIFTSRQVLNKTVINNYKDKLLICYHDNHDLLMYLKRIKIEKKINIFIQTPNKMQKYIKQIINTL